MQLKINTHAKNYSNVLNVNKKMGLIKESFSTNYKNFRAQFIVKKV